MPIRLKDYSSSLDRGASRAKEGLWILAKLFFFYPKIPLPSAFRCFLLRLFGADIGSDVVIRAGVDITFPWKLEIGDSSWIGEDVKLLNLADIVIGSNCCISQRAFLCTGSHDFSSVTFGLITKPIVVKYSSWIAAQAFVGPGVTIGECSMVGAGSVVSRDVPAYCLLSGNPAKVVKSLSLANSEEAV